MLGLFSKFKKNKKPVKPLETPPIPEGEEPQNQFPPGPQGMPPPSQMPYQGAPFPSQGPPQQQMAPQAPYPQGQPLPQQNPMPEFSLPPQQGYMPGSREEPEFYEDQQYEMQPQAPMPPYPQSQQAQMPYPQMGMQQPPYPPQRVPPLQPQFRFYQSATPEEVEQKQEVPFDVSQELLTLPEVHKKEHPELYEGPEENFEEEIPEYEEPVHKKKIRQAPKQFITMNSLFEVGEQLVNLSEDLTLARDTSFRLTDLNEQEIEKMAKWHTLLHSAEMRIAEIDKLLFRA